MARRMVVVPFDWVKDMVKYPTEVQRKVDENQFVRELNTKFAEAQPPPVEVNEPETPEKEAPKPTRKQAEIPKKTLQTDRQTAASSKQKSDVSFPEPYSNVKRRLYDAGAIDKDGRVFSPKGKVVVRSNINDVIDSISGRRTRQATGAAQIKKKLASLGIKEPQVGTGKWIRL